MFVCATSGDEEEVDINDSQSPTTIPQSYEEIYKISLRNRQRNKDKKRNREGQDQSDPANAESDANFPIASFTGIPSSDSGTLSDGGGGGRSLISCALFSCYNSADHSYDTQ